jgi:hypothetical protein
VDRSKDTLYFSSNASLEYLDGSLPGDFGFDPLGLLDPVNSGGFITPQWLQYSEVIHGRWAMLGAAGCIAPEILAKAGVIPEATGIRWFESGVIPPAGTYQGYWTDPWSLFYIEVLAMQFAELKRLQDFRFPGSQGKQYFLGLEKIFEGSGNPAYPGGCSSRDVDRIPGAGGCGGPWSCSCRCSPVAAGAKKQRRWSHAAHSQEQQGGSLGGPYAAARRGAASRYIRLLPHAAWGRVGTWQQVGFITQGCAV